MGKKITHLIASKDRGNNFDTVEDWTKNCKNIGVKMNNYFIVNKASKSGRAAEDWDRVEAYLKAHNVSYEARITRARGDAMAWTREITEANPACHIFAMGGDGTLNEVLNGIADFEKVVYTPLPAGSGNDFVRGVGIKGTALEILERALDETGPVKQLDIGRVSHKDGSRFFGVSSGIGVDAYVCLQALDSKLKKVLNKIHLGSATYGLLTVGDILTMPLSDAIVTWDNNEPVEIHQGIFIAAMNCPAEGGGIRMVPYAKPDSGFLSAFMAHDISRIACFMKLPFLVAGKHEKLKGFTFADFSKMNIKMDKAMCVHADGEHIGFLDEITIECLPKILKIKY